ncbi:ephrin-B2-like [Actinia tenebrosa]|uniref:Ephrin-B2-like n=1 Tax=Actinia tenebrosa TaxID=6105 RepID=A0A6P8HHJ4_ACTTE|nr:ephrin-B2-like [Actinia tenebrosa]
MKLLCFNFKLLYFSVLLFVIEFTLRGLGHIYMPLHWSPLNPKFQPSSNSSYYRMNVLPMSKLNIICPNNVLNPIKLQQSPAKDQLYENFWIVDKQSFDSCEVNTSIPTNRLLYECNEPLKLKYYLLVFLDVSPSVHSLEFDRGKDYYFISTSDGTKSTLKSTKHGHCKTDRMKMVLHVCLNEQDPLCIEQPVTTPKPTTYPTTTTKPTTTTQPPTTTPTTRSTTTSESTIETTEKKRATVNDAPMSENDITKRNDDDLVHNTEKRMNYPTPHMEAAKKERTAAEIAEDATWFILVAVMGTLLAVSVSCNIYMLCCRKDHRRSEIADKRSSAAHTLLKENSKVDRV